MKRKKKYIYTYKTVLTALDRRSINVDEREKFYVLSCVHSMFRTFVSTLHILCGLCSLSFSLLFLSSHCFFFFFFFLYIYTYLTFFPFSYKKSVKRKKKKIVERQRVPSTREKFERSVGQAISTRVLEAISSSSIEREIIMNSIFTYPVT